MTFGEKVLTLAATVYVCIGFIKTSDEQISNTTNKFIERVQAPILLQVSYYVHSFKKNKVDYDH